MKLTLLVGAALPIAVALWTRRLWFSTFPLLIWRRSGREGLGKMVTTDSNANLDIYNRWAPSYNAELRSWGFDAPEKSTSMLEHAFRRVGGLKTRATLDLGCGTGLQAPSLRQSGFSPLTGVDLSAEMLAQAESTRLYAKLVRWDLNFALPFEDHVFDAAVCTAVLSYIDSRNEPNLLSELSRVVKPGGVIVATLRSDLSDWKARIRDLEESGQLRLLEESSPAPFLPQNPIYASKLLIIYYCFVVL